MCHFNLVHKFTSVPQAMKILDAKAAVDKEWDKLEILLSWQMTKVRNKRKGHQRGIERRTVHFSTLMDIASS